MGWDKETEGIRARREAALAMGGAEAVDRQHGKGRLTVRERIDVLVDEGSFAEQGPMAGHSEIDDEGRLVEFTPGNYVLGMARLDGRPCVVGGEDFTLKGGSPTPAGLRKSVYAEQLAVQYRVPLVRLLEGGGGSVAGTRGGKNAGKGGGGAHAGDPVYVTPRFMSFAEAMAAVPVVSVALGPVAGFPAARLVSSHFSIMVRDTSQVLIAGPAVVERALGEKKTKEELGGAAVHMHSGVVDNLADDEAGALAQVRRFLSYLPTNVWEPAPRVACDDDPARAESELNSIIPRDRRKAFDIRRVLELVFDAGSFFEMSAGYGPSQVTGLARLDGQAVGVWANDCRFWAGAMDADGAQKARRFIDLCDSFHLPIISLVDEPGFMIGSGAEAAGTIRYGAQTIFAANQSSVPWAAVHLRKAFGVAAAAHFGPDSYVLAWPSAESGALPVEGGVAVAFGREIAAADDPDALRSELEEQFAASRTPFPRAESFGVHDLIEPAETRERLCRWVEWVQPRLATLVGPTSHTVRP